jgi:alkylation response protein AidB-like acyl-CoA dehydrogenase
MQAELSGDQALLRDTTVRFIEARLPVAATRALHDDPVGFDRAWLGVAAELGWFSMLVPEEDGGGSVSGEGMVDAAILAEVQGRHVQPGPFVPMNVVAATVARHGSADQRSDLLPGIAAGELVCTWAWADAAGDWDDGVGVTATTAGGQVRLDGARGVVQDAASADRLLVAGCLDGEPVHVLVASDAPGITITPLSSLDLGRRFGHVAFEGVEVPVDSVIRGTEVSEHALAIAVVLNLAETIGAADTLFTMTVDYAKDRVAFGRPIGSFQAIKHILADELLSLEICKAAVAAAVTAVQRRDDAAPEVVSMASAAVGERAAELAQQCLQVHGGIGYTWEHDLHLYLRRIQSNGALYGDAWWHRERVCRFHRLGASA